MSIRVHGLGVIATLCCLIAAPLSAQKTVTTAEDALAAAKEEYGPPPPEEPKRAECDDPVGDEIVVCAALEEQSQFRVRSSLDQGDESHLEWAGDAPDVAGPGIFKGKATASGCIKGVTCPPPPAYIFDITALPEPPPGSDAEKIAKGEMRPR